MPEAIPTTSSSDLDRRAAARVGFGAQVSVCEFRGGEVPEREFRPVKGADLSQTGMSFITKQWPASDELLLRFNEKSRAVAKIVSARRAEDEDGEPRFEVSCQFRQWLS